MKNIFYGPRLAHHRRQEIMESSKLEFEEFIELKLKI